MEGSNGAGGAAENIKNCQLACATFFTKSHLEEHAEHRDLSDVALPAACALLSRQPSTSMAGKGSNPPVLVRTHVLQVVRCFS